jgi:hypothetical protein
VQTESKTEKLNFCCVLRGSDLTGIVNDAIVKLGEISKVADLDAFFKNVTEIFNNEEAYTRFSKYLSNSKQNGKKFFTTFINIEAARVC